MVKYDMSMRGEVKCVDTEMNLACGNRTGILAKFMEKAKPMRPPRMGECFSIGECVRRLVRLRLHS
jgi:hypothetical protein